MKYPLSAIGCMLLVITIGVAAQGQSASPAEGTLTQPSKAQATERQPEPAPKAELAAGHWLALMDAGRYDASWDQAANLFKGAVTKTNWESAIRSARAPLGAVKSRKLKSAQFATTLPGAPDGEYVVVQFETQFENNATAIETVTPSKEKDGSWRVSGYFVK